MDPKVPRYAESDCIFRPEHVILGVARRMIGGVDQLAETNSCGQSSDFVPVFVRGKRHHFLGQVEKVRSSSQACANSYTVRRSNFRTRQAISCFSAWQALYRPGSPLMRRSAIGIGPRVQNAVVDLDSGSCTSTVRSAYRPSRIQAPWNSERSGSLSSR